jgi:hypothetical protein
LAISDGVNSLKAVIHRAYGSPEKVLSLEEVVYGRLELAMPLMIIIGMHGLVILFKWKLRRQAWFWIAMTVSAALHVPLILFVPWTTRWVPALAITVGATADFFLILWILLVVGKFMGRPKTEEG